MGHIAKLCPEPKKERPTREKREEKPKKDNKPKKVREPITCYNCEKEGHIGRDCPEKKAQKPREERKARDPITCRQCGKEGHFARECDSSPEYKSDDEEVNDEKLTPDQKIERDLCKGAVYYADVEKASAKPKKAEMREHIAITDTKVEATEFTGSRFEQDRKLGST
jgi:CRISPR/Cas system CSM-associated protein Csm3 (group 7 of RAMP superfamily)